MTSNARPASRGCVYLRRSDGKQESSLETQLEWALRKAKEYPIRIQADKSTLQRMIRDNLSHLDDLYLDNAITGADMERPGFLAMINAAKNDRSISHILVYKRDRLARPTEPLQMMSLERALCTSGITLVFSDGIVDPYHADDTDLSHIVKMLFGYHESGQYLKNHAERIILVKEKLAKDGYRTGGNPPYGFARWLVDPNGEYVEKLPKGKYVRQEGYHVRLRVDDPDKIKVWLLMLDLRYKGWGLKRIAAYLNELRIPSPDAGRTRTDNGVRHEVSSLWHHNTIAELCHNTAILGIQQYGRRSEGAHRRIGPAGPRKLSESDRTSSGKLRMVFNDEELIVSAPTGTGSHFDAQAWEDIQKLSSKRGQSQRGVPRSKDWSKYPLSCRVIDLTEDCGWPMYALTSGDRRIYKCGRYLKTGGAECHHNIVDADAMLRFSLRTLSEVVARMGKRERLRELLVAKANAEAMNPTQSHAKARRDALEKKIAAASKDLEVVARRMATEQDDRRYDAIGKQHDLIAAELERDKKALAELPPDLDTKDPTSGVDAAMLLLDRIASVSSDPSLRQQLPGLFESLGLKIGLTFGPGLKGKREVRKLRSGVIAFGNEPLPVQTYGKDNREDPGSSSKKGSRKSLAVRKSEVAANGDGSPTSSAQSYRRQKEGFSLNKVSRGDKI